MISKKKMTAKRYKGKRRDVHSAVPVKKVTCFLPLGGKNGILAKKNKGI